VERQDSRRAGNGTGDERRATSRSTDRQLLEEAVLRLRELEPLLEAARRHPLIRALLRRI
jgi:hypothetical protein